MEVLKNCFRNLETCSFYPVEEKEKKAFVLMSLDETFNEVYRVGIKGGLEEIGWECDRSDERWDTPEVVCTICKSIQEASLIVADVTGKKPNVFLELGLSFGLEKNILLIAQDFGDLPFDVRTFRAIKYDSTNLEELQKNLQEAIDKLRPIARMPEEAMAFQEELDRIQKENIEGLPKMIEVKVQNIQHALGDAVPKVHFTITFYNHSIFDVRMVNFSYRPELTGIHGGQLDRRDRTIELKLPHQDSAYLNDSFEIPKGIVDKLMEWQELGYKGTHSEVCWNIEYWITIVGIRDFRFSGIVEGRKRYHEI